MLLSWSPSWISQIGEREKCKQKIQFTHFVLYEFSRRAAMMQRFWKLVLDSDRSWPCASTRPWPWTWTRPHLLKPKSNPKKQTPISSIFPNFPLRHAANPKQCLYNSRLECAIFWMLSSTENVVSILTDNRRRLDLLCGKESRRCNQSWSGTCSGEGGWRHSWEGHSTQQPRFERTWPPWPVRWQRW